MRKIVSAILMASATSAFASGSTPTLAEVRSIMHRQSVITGLSSDIDRRGNTLYFRECTESNMAKQYEQVMNSIKTQDKVARMLAADEADRTAGIISKCAFVQEDNPEFANNRPNYSIQQWADKVAQMLTISAMINQNKAKGMEALALAQFANDSQMVDQLQQTFGLKAPDLGHNAELGGSAVSLISEREGNTFAFDRKYGGKLIQVKGKVSTIYGNDSVTVKLIGNTKKSVDNMGQQDFVYCHVSNSEAMDKVASIKNGGQVTVQGHFESDPRAFGINLTDCGIK